MTEAKLQSIEARLRTLDPSHLEALAAWLDLKYPNEADSQVQYDLWEMASILRTDIPALIAEMRRLQAILTSMQGVAPHTTYVTGQPGDTSGD